MAILTIGRMRNRVEKTNIKTLFMETILEMTAMGWTIF
jgi:hypothetical protein